VNGHELFAALGALPGVRSARADTRGIEQTRVLADLEVALVSPDADEQALRRTWKTRANGGEMPLLLVSDASGGDGALHALGPLGAGGPVRLIGAEDLLRVIERLPARSPLIAVRELAQELERLDRRGVAGLVVNGLGTEHLYGVRLRDSQRWSRLGELARGAGGQWRELLTGLGYAFDRLGRGYLARHEGRPVCVVLPLAEPAAFAKLDPEGRPPEGLLLNACAQERARYGILASGGRLRLFDAQPVSGSAVARYLELDATTLPEEDRPLLGLLSPSYLADGGFAALMRDAQAFGAALRERIDRAIREDVLPVLGRELGRWAAAEGWDLQDDAHRAPLEAAALTFVFRALFLLYAESAGHLPVAQEAYRPHALSQIVRDAAEQGERLGARSTALWRRIALLIDAMRTGNPAMAIPPYNGALFAADGFEGAEVLERASVSDAALGPALAALGTDPQTGTGVDFSGLAIGHLGHIYEGLLSLRLSVADRPYRYDARRDRYAPADADDAEIAGGELLWLTDEGGRKGGGVYYTPEQLVRHLVRGAVARPFDDHLARVREAAAADPAAAARELFAFRVLDPACGSAHFLAVVVDELADRVARFLAETPLPAVQRQIDDLRAGAAETHGAGIDDVALLRRLVLKRCVYGVDLSPMGAEIAKVSLWLASFVPGLALSYLDHNVVVGNSLIGVASPGQVREPGEENGQIGMLAQPLRDAIDAGARAAAELFDQPDRTPDEVQESAEADGRSHVAVAGARRLLDLWVADALGLAGARGELWDRGAKIVEGLASAKADEAARVAAEQRTLHWPLAFPEVFAGARSGFDAVVGNPPWEEVNVDELGFYVRYRPGLRALPERERRAALERLIGERPDLPDRFTADRKRVAVVRAYFSPGSGYSGSPGNADLYKFFCQRYRLLLREGGSLGVVLPRSAFSAKGSEDFRRWLLERSTLRRVDFLLNRGRWAFDAEERYTASLLVAQAAKPPRDLTFEVAGVAASAAAFERQTAAPGVAVSPSALNAALAVPLVSSKPAAELLARLEGEPFPLGAGRWRCFAIQGDFNETTDRRLWDGAEDGRPLWKGASFGQFDPHGAGSRPCPASDAALAKASKPRPGGGSLLAGSVGVRARAAAVRAELEGPRVAFRDVSRAIDSRTIIAALTPAGAFLSNTAPYLAFLDDRDLDRAACLGLMNSLAFDWQARRFVETHVNFFILEGLRLPSLTDDHYDGIAKAAARLSCPDARYSAFATSTGVEAGPLDEDERERLRVEVDALVADAWSLDEGDLDVIFDDFTLDAVPAAYRDRLHARLAELASQR